MKVKSRILPVLVAGLLAATVSGAAAQERADGPSFFEATLTFVGPPTEPEPGTSGDGWEGYVGMGTADIAVDAGDPRASGLWDLVRNGTDIELPDGRLSIERATSILINDQGRWTGEGTITVRGEQGPPSHVGALYRLEVLVPTRASSSSSTAPDSTSRCRSSGGASSTQRRRHRPHRSR